MGLRGAAKGRGGRPLGWALGPSKPRVSPLSSFAAPWALWEAHQPTQGLVPQPTQGLVPSHSWPMHASGAGGPSRWTPETLPVVPVDYR